jgi:4-amino-4-deoxy-L-arabinose transferase-like glycosyltransferase
MIYQLKPPGEFWSQESLDALQEWLVLVGLILAVVLAILAVFSFARKLFDKRKRAGLD